MRRDTRAPPPLADWMLSRLLRGRRSQALIGDLAEEYAHGRSRAWYWHQALRAIAADMREHPTPRHAFGALRFMMIVCVIAGASLDAKWPLFLLALDPSWVLLLRWHHQHRSQLRK